MQDALRTFGTRYAQDARGARYAQDALKTFGTRYAQDQGQEQVQEQEQEEDQDQDQQTIGKREPCQKTLFLSLLVSRSLGL